MDYHFQKILYRNTWNKIMFLIISLSLSACSNVMSPQSSSQTTYRYFNVQEINGKITKIIPVPDKAGPLWAKHVSQQKWDWNASKKDDDLPYFKGPIPFVLPSKKGSGDPFYPHNHEPSITWLNNGDLLAIWFSTIKESGTEMMVLASRLRAGKTTWDSSSVFFKSKGRNMTGMSLFHDGSGKIYHFNSIGPEGVTGWTNLAILMRTSDDNGVTWTIPRAIAPEFEKRHQVIDGTLKTSSGVLIQPCDASPAASGGTALHMSKDGGKTWNDPGEEKPAPEFQNGSIGEGTIAGIHGHVVELKDGRLLAFGRSDNINGRMPESISGDMGKTWTYSAGPFPPIGGGQRIVLLRLHEGPILLVSFANDPMIFIDKDGNKFQGTGMFAALSYDEGKSWPVRKLITPGYGKYDGGAWTDIFLAAPDKAEPKGYLAATQTPDDLIHLISSRLYYCFNLKWLETP